jgi:hypothetical protein
MMLRALALSGTGPGGEKEQQNLLGYLGQTDTLRQQYQLSALQAQREHEKQIEETLRPRFKTTVKDDKGNTKEIDDLPGYERFKADMATRGLDIYGAGRPQVDRALAEWQARDRMEQRMRAIQAASGSPFHDQNISQRVQPVGLRGGLGLTDVISSPNISLGDWGRSFLGGVRNQVVVRPGIDPVTGKPKDQLFPAARTLGDQPGQVDVDALRYALGR